MGRPEPRAGSPSQRVPPTRRPIHARQSLRTKAITTQGQSRRSPCRPGSQRQEGQLRRATVSNCQPETGAPSTSGPWGLPDQLLPGGGGMDTSPHLPGLLPGQEASKAQRFLLPWGQGRGGRCARRAGSEASSNWHFILPSPRPRAPPSPDGGPRPPYFWDSNSTSSRQTDPLPHRVPGGRQFATETNESNLWAKQRQLPQSPCLPAQ